MIPWGRHHLHLQADLNSAERFVNILSEHSRLRGLIRASGLLYSCRSSLLCRWMVTGVENMLIELIEVEQCLFDFHECIVLGFRLSRMNISRR